MAEAHSARFSIDVMGFGAQQASDMLAGSHPLFSELLVAEMPEIAALNVGAATRCSATDATAMMRGLAYTLDPMVWEPIRAVLQVAAPGLISYTDYIQFHTDRPGWVCRTEWSGVPGIPPDAVQIAVRMRATDDAVGCRLDYELAVRCTLPLVGGLVERSIAATFQRTCQRLPRVMQAYFSAFDKPL